MNRVPRALAQIIWARNHSPCEHRSIQSPTRSEASTTSASWYLAPALLTSSLMAKKQVAFLPLRIPAFTGIQAAWQIAATTLPAASMSGTAMAR